MFKPLPTKCIEAFLKSLGFYYDRTVGSHDLWKKRGNWRSMPVRGNDKDMPAFHIRTCSKVTGYTTDQIYAWAQKNC